MKPCGALHPFTTNAYASSPAFKEKNMSAEKIETEEQRAFRAQARDWMKGRLPPRRAEEAAMDWEDQALVAKDREIQRALWDGGLAGITLPTQYGGLGLDKTFEDVFYQEAEPYRLPWHFGNAFNVVVPTLLAHASEALKTRYLPLILKGEHIWCQLLSEPSGGSDLAGLVTKAELRGDQWILNGSKVWTTGGLDCDMGICLARTDSTVPKHAGLTMFVVDMRAPGLTISPLKLIAGNSDFCQEFLDDVAVPADHVVGEVNGGWAVASTQLGAERAGMARGWHMGMKAAVESAEIKLSPDYVELARSLNLTTDAYARQLIGEAFVLDAVHKLTTRRVAVGMRNGALPPTAGGISSLMAARTDVRRTAVMSALTGPAGVAVLPGGDGPVWGMSRVCTHRIGGGTTEMQSNSVSERFLGLPREPSTDNAVPFNQRKTGPERSA
jgi:alkylation response protein AidB-like acyl-CoA dehydrogenase